MGIFRTIKIDVLAKYMDDLNKAPGLKEVYDSIVLFRYQDQEGTTS